MLVYSLYSNNKLHLFRTDHDPSGKKHKGSTSLQRILTPVALCWVRLERVLSVASKDTLALCLRTHTQANKRSRPRVAKKFPTRFCWDAFLHCVCVCLLSSQKIIEGISVNKITNFLVTDRYNNNAYVLRVCVCV